MNTKTIFLGAVFLVIVLAGILTWPYFKRAAFQGAAEDLATAPKTPAPAHEIPSVVVKNMDDAETKREKSLSELSRPKPITVYAKVVDQSGRPVSGAKAIVVSALAAPGANKKLELEQTSDSDGTLSFSTTWRMLSVTVTKPGYHDLIASSATFQYAKSAFTPPPKPDSGNPVLFVLQR